MRSLNQKTPRTAAPPLSTAHCGSSLRLRFARIVPGPPTRLPPASPVTLLAALRLGRFPACAGFSVFALEEATKEG